MVVVGGWVGVAEHVHSRPCPNVQLRSLPHVTAVKRWVGRPPWKSRCGRSRRPMRTVLPLAIVTELLYAGPSTCQCHVPGAPVWLNACIPWPLQKSVDNDIAETARKYRTPAIS